jgi:glycosyltransferase involved in cell wall biosynthesis
MLPKIFIVADWYLPGYKAGGLVTAVANLVEFMGDAFELFVFTRDSDLTDALPYLGIRQNEWTEVGKARVLYTRDLSFSHLRRRIVEVQPEIIYLNSFFSKLTVKTLCLRSLGLLPPCAVVLAPRGEFSPGALRIKRWRKSIYRTAALRIGLYGGVIWQASSQLEQDHIAAELAVAQVPDPCIHVAWDLPSPDWLQAAKGPPKPPKSTGVRFLLISRISPMKNILFAIELLTNLIGAVEFDIYGPIDVARYWEECQKGMESLPDNVIVRYCDAIPRGLVPNIAANHDFFLMPTRGENFGYVILEAMAAGCPVVLSDLTPWRSATESGAGWSLPLDDRELWRNVLQQCVDMEPQTYARYSQRAREFVEAWATSNNHVERTFQLFNRALEGHARTTAARSLGASPEMRE